MVPCVAASDPTERMNGTSERLACDDPCPSFEWSKETNTMSTEETKALIPHCWGECFNRGNLAVVDAFVATNYRWHGPSQEVSGRDGIKQVITLFRTAFPDLHMIFEDQL